MMEKDLMRLDKDSRDIDMRMQALKPQILKLTEDKNHYHKFVTCWFWWAQSWVLVFDLKGRGGHTQG